MTEGDSVRSETSDPRLSTTVTAEVGAGEVTDARCQVGSVQLLDLLLLPSHQEPAS